MKPFILLITTLFFTQLSLAQTTCNCCTEPYTYFDFWEGNWNVLDADGKKVGENTIQKAEANCILIENWDNLNSGTGTSINFYDKAEASWNQVWVDSQGNVLRLKGNLINGKMVLKSKILQGEKYSYYNQVTWTPNQNNTVTQLWEIYKADGTLLQTAFKGIYHKKNE